MAVSAGENQCPVGLDDFVEIAVKCQDVPELEFMRSGKSGLVVEQVMKGDVNFNFRCSSKEQPNKAVFIKYSAPYCRSSPQLELTSARLETEYYAMLRSYQAFPESVAKPICFSKEKNIGKLHHSTHVNTLSAEEFAGLKAQINCPDIVQSTGEFYFKDMYHDETALKELKPQHSKMRDEFLSDADVQSALSLCKQYLKQEECLLHNDLHFNSIMVKGNMPKMVDLEFAKVGNPARDLSLILAMNMAMYYFHLLCPENNTEHRRVAYQLLDSCKCFMETYYENMTAYSGDVESYKRQMARQISGLVGCELAARVLGTPHIPSIQDAKHVADVETEILQCAIRLLKKHTQIESIDRMLFIGLMLC